MRTLRSPLSDPQTVSYAKDTWITQIRRNLNFYRIHVLFFTFTPLIAASIFYGSNGATRIPFIDALFVCVSSITVTGLSTIDLSSATAWQQAILFILMCMGSPVTVSWLIVYVRRYFFAKKFENIIESQLSSRITTTRDVSTIKQPSRWRAPWLNINVVRSSRSSSTQAQTSNTAASKNVVRTDMIRRLDGAPRLVDPSGWVESGHGGPQTGDVNTVSRQQERIFTISPIPVDEEEGQDGADEGGGINSGDSITPPGNDPTSKADSRPTSGVLRIGSLRRSNSFGPSHFKPRLSTRVPSGADIERDRPLTALPGPTKDRERQFPRTQTIEFVAPDHEPTPFHGRNFAAHARKTSRGSIRELSPSAALRNRGSIREPDGPTSRDPSVRRGSILSEQHLHSDNDWRRSFPARTATMQSNKSSIRPTRPSAKEEDFGGFPLPHVIISHLLRRFFPRLQQRLTRTVTIPYTTTVQSQRGGQTTVLGAKPVPYISFDAIVGRNSKFHGLTREHLEELGGVEYRALNMLLWIVGLYHVGVPLFAFVIIAPYISQPRWIGVFHPPQQHRFVSPVWYSLFQVISAYTNTGTSLVDQSMVPFQKAYPEVLILPFVILAGNTAFPIFLRFVIWLLSKTVKQHSRARETLHFLLDHPRRCFIYLFPSHQTWFLLTVLFLLNFTDWFFFLVLDIGNPAIDSVPLGTRFAIGLLQATAVRAAGFGTVALSALAPAVKVLYALMMYVSVYPIAMSVRSTNVYEERSLGVFQDEDEDDEEAALRHEGDGSRARIWGKYLASHARKQLSFDMWWLALALFLVCIVEKNHLEDENKSFWFNIFTIVFELTSAYGTVGLSLGTPNANYSFSGELRPLSKLIICAVMLRGRHRGLPVAIDRAVLLPAEFKKDEDDEVATGPSARRTNRFDDSSRPQGDIDDEKGYGGDEDGNGLPETHMNGSARASEKMVEATAYGERTEHTT